MNTPTILPPLKDEGSAGGLLYKYDSNGDLELTLAPGVRETLLLAAQESDDGEYLSRDQTMYDFFETFMGNSEFDWINPESCADLTDAPLLGILGDVESAEDMARRIGMQSGCPVVARWGWMSYALRSLMGQLVEHGKATLVSSY